MPELKRLDLSNIPEAKCSAWVQSTAHGNVDVIIAGWAIGLSEAQFDALLDRLGPLVRDRRGGPRDLNR